MKETRMSFKLTVVMVVVVLVAVPSCHSIFHYLSFKCPKKRTQCHEEEGRYCTKKLRDCDVVLKDIRCGFFRPGCTCCVDCPSTGECSVACKPECANTEHLEAGVCGDYCKCCPPCTQGICDGRCVGDASFCSVEEYISSGCGEGACTCCSKCIADPPCQEAGGICVGAGKECPCGFWPNPDLGCNNGTSDCLCCVACIPSPECSNGGRCVSDPSTCQTVSGDAYISTDECTSGGAISCSCCKTCTPDQTCMSESGTCFNMNAECPSGNVVSMSGKCSDDDQCKCCIPDSLFLSQCTPSSECSNGGRCVSDLSTCLTQTGIEYISTDECTSGGAISCSCCKTCIPDETCISKGGTCFNMNAECPSGNVVSMSGKCSDDDQCKCCILDQA